jgi:drug/metabolite transporter (DMT)-like permease
MGDGGCRVRRAYAYTLIIVALWGVSLVLTKALLLAARGGVTLTPLQVALYAMGPGWVSLFLVLAARRRLHLIGSISARGWMVLGAMGFFGWAGYRVALNFAFVRLPLPDAIIINYLHPAFVVLFQGVGFSAVVRPLTRWETEGNRARRPGPTQLGLGFLVCLLGVALIATEGHLAHLGHITSAWGALSALFAAFSWGVYSNLDRFVPARKDASAPAVLADIYTFLSMTFGLLMLAAVALDTSELSSISGFTVPLYFGPWGPAHAGAWWLIVIMGVAVYGGSYTLWLYALERGSRLGEAHKLPPLTYLTPVVGVTLGWLVLREPFGPGFWQGAALIALGNTINAWPRRL